MIDEQVFELLKDRLDRQDSVLSKILTQTTLTNGRVTGHDHRLAALELAQQEQQTRRVRRADLRRSRVELLVSGVFLLMAGAEGDRLLHLLARLF